MRRLSIGRLIAVALLGTIVSLASFDTAEACRWFWRHQVCGYPAVVCPPAPCCGEVVTYSSCEPACGTSVSDGGGCGATVTGDYLIQTEPQSSCCEASPIIEPYPSAAGDAVPVVEEPEPAEAPAVDVSEPDPVVAEPSEPVVDEPPPVDVDVTDDSPLDTGSLFDEAPAEEPALDEPTIVDEPADLDVFDEPAADDALPGAEEPAGDVDPADALDDIFSAPPDAGDALPGDVDLPVEDPADALPADGGDAPTDDLDDLFGAAPAESTDDARMATNPDVATEPALDDLFSEPAPATDLPADVPSTDAVEEVDDLFPAEPAATDPPATDDTGADDLDDLFGKAPAVESTRTVTHQSETMPVRVWTDDTGRYQTVGQLVKISATHVRLLKNNGNFTTVPKTRLSEADLAYVQKMVEQLGIEAMDQVARR